MKNSLIRKHAQEALWKPFKEVAGKAINAKGYVEEVVDNLFRGARYKLFRTNDPPDIAFGESRVFGNSLTWNN
jgi:hypothetical protein